MNTKQDTKPGVGISGSFLLRIRHPHKTELNQLSAGWLGLRGIVVGVHFSVRLQLIFSKESRSSKKFKKQCLRSELLCAHSQDPSSEDIPED